MSWYIEVLKNYVNFEGRARRKEYWMFVLINIIISIVLALVGRAMHSTLLSNLYSLAVFLPSIAVGARRLHDTGRSGWWQLIGIIPVIGWIPLLIFFAMNGDPGPNEYGPDPKEYDGTTAYA